MLDRQPDDPFVNLNATADRSSAQHFAISFDKNTAMAVVALIFAVMAFGGVMVGAVLLPEIIAARADKAATGSIIRADIAEREARVAIDQVSMLRLEMAKRGVIADNH